MLGVVLLEYLLVFLWCSAFSACSWFLINMRNAHFVFVYLCRSTCKSLELGFDACSDLDMD